MMSEYDYVVHKITNLPECSDSVVKQKHDKPKIEKFKKKPEEEFDTVFQRALAQPHEIIDQANSVGGET